MKTSIITACMIMMVTGGLLADGAWAAEPNGVAKETGPTETLASEKQPLIQMAILLDTSGSMSGLINQARAELWAIVNEFIFATREDRQPELQVALYEYGKSLLPESEGYIRMIVPLTTDLDRISEELFALKTNGGQEYCGWVIKQATESLQWSEGPDDLKLIFIAGNEPFTQGPVDYREACKAAVSKGIVVNTIHCGTDGAGLEGKWKDGAVLADGRYLNIDHNRRRIHIAAPQDREIAELGIELNHTYIPYGARANEAAERQAAQDRNAAAASKEANVQRAVSKSSTHYRNDAWDLVDAVKHNQVDLEDVEAEDLPEQMQQMTVAQQRAYIESKMKERAELQQRIQQLNEQRKKYVAEEMKNRQSAEDTLGSAIIQVIRQQAASRNFSFETEQKSQ